MANGRAVVYFARAAHVFSAQIKCRHCTGPKAFFPIDNCRFCDYLASKWKKSDDKRNHTHI